MRNIFYLDHILLAVLSSRGYSLICLFVLRQIFLWKEFFIFFTNRNFDLIRSLIFPTIRLKLLWRLRCIEKIKFHVLWNEESQYHRWMEGAPAAVNRQMMMDFVRFVGIWRKLLNACIIFLVSFFDFPFTSTQSVKFNLKALKMSKLILSFTFALFKSILAWDREMKLI